MKRPESVGLVLVASAALQLACGGGTPSSPNSVPAAEMSTVTDPQGNVYRTIRIGTQWWMAENLKSTRGADGTALPDVWAYLDDESNVTPYGRLYAWNTATMPLIRGWHLPSSAEWTTLINAVGVANAGTLLTQGGSSGFDAVFGGTRNYDGSYVGIGVMGQYWSSTAFTVDHAETVTFWSNRAQVERRGLGFIGGVSVRLVRDN